MIVLLGLTKTDLASLVRKVDPLVLLVLSSEHHTEIVVIRQAHDSRLGLDAGACCFTFKGCDRGAEEEE